MINNVNNFLAAKVKTPNSPVTGAQYNYLIDLLNAQIKILSLAISDGLTINSSGQVTLGNELNALQALADATGFMKKAGDATYSIDPTEYEPHTNELTALSALDDIAGFVKKVSDGEYEIDVKSYATKTEATAYAIALG